MKLFIASVLMKRTEEDESMTFKSVVGYAFVSCEEVAEADLAVISKRQYPDFNVVDINIMKMSPITILKGFLGLLYSWNTDQ